MVLDELQQAGAAVVAVVGLSADLLLTGGDILLSVSDLLFTGTAVLNGALGTELGLDETLLRNALVAVAVLYLVNLVAQLRDRITDSDSDP